MKTIRVILIIALVCNVVFCYANNEKKVEDKTFQAFLDKFKTIKPPVNYKKLSENSLMTKEEAIRFLHKTEIDLVATIEEIGENGGIYTTKEEHTAGCDFKYLLNDSIYILCTREWSQENIGDPYGVINIARVYLNAFSMQGKRMNKCLVGEHFTYQADWVSFVLLDKNHIRVFYYMRDYTKKERGFLSTVYYVNYLITDDGSFIEQDKSDITYLKNFAIKYSTYKPQSDDPMNEYDF
jgi:hypothetical protein